MGCINEEDGGCPMKYLEKSEEWHLGYDGAAMDYPMNKNKSKEWQTGWKQYQQDIDNTESAQWQ